MEVLDIGSRFAAKSANAPGEPGASEFPGHSDSEVKQVALDVR